MKRLTKTQKQVVNLNKEIEHLGVDIKYIPKDIMKDKDVQKSLKDLSDVLGELLVKLQKSAKKQITGKKISVKKGKDNLYKIVEKKK